MKNQLNELKSIIRKEIKAAINEVESKYADSFELDQAKGGTDTSMDKAHKTLLKLQKDMDKLFADYKAKKIDAKTSSTLIKQEIFRLYFNLIIGKSKRRLLL